MISSVENQVLAHDGQTDEAEISTGNGVHRSADINAGETGTIVSDRVLMSIAGQMRVEGLSKEGKARIMPEECKSVRSCLWIVPCRCQSTLAGMPLCTISTSN